MYLECLVEKKSQLFILEMIYPAMEADFRLFSSYYSIGLKSIWGISNKTFFEEGSHGNQ